MPEPSRNTFVTTYPGKAIWTLGAVALNALKLPIWILLYIVPSNRPNPKWSFRQALRMRMLTAYLWNFAYVEAKTPLSLKPKGERERFVRVPPAGKQYLLGPLLKDPEIQPVEVGGTWYPKVPGPNSKPDLVIIHIHGGAYIMGDGREKDAGYAARCLLKNSKASHVFCPQYRLASNPGGRFPAALQDAIACYLYVLYTVGVAPSKIIVGGDSAGGNLTLALQRYLAEYGAETGIPNFASSWLHSPWPNPKSSFKSRSDFDKAPNRPYDYINGEFGSWGAECYAPDQSTGLTIADPYISPMEHPFHTPIPTWISAGENEVLLHDQVRLYETYKTIKENVLDLSFEPDSPHDIILTSWFHCFHDQAANAVKKAQKFHDLHASS